MVKKHQQKIKLLYLLFAAIWIVFLGRLVMLQVVQKERFHQAALNQQNLVIDINARRGTIYDRNLKVLARDIDSRSYYIVPHKIGDKKKAARQLSRITGKSGWLDKFKNHSRFLWVARITDDKLAKRLKKSDIETLNHIIEPRRVYPAGDLGKSLLGRVDVDINGLSGIELQYDELLAGSGGKAILKRDGLGQSYYFEDKPLVEPLSGSDIVLTLDLDLQHILEQEIIAALTENEAEAGIGLFLKVGTGEVLACADIDSLYRPTMRNRAVVDQYEPGSTFKVVTAAAALSSGLFEPETILDVENGKFRIGRHFIRDDHAYDSLTLEDVVVFSSNIGASKLALDIGQNVMFKHIKEAGFATCSGIDFPGEAKGSVNRPQWRDHLLANISFGHGISASPLQIVTLYGALASGGDLYKPYIAAKVIDSEGVCKYLNSPYKVRKVFDRQVVGIVNNFLSEVVQRGTATKANSKIVSIAGKTGTALKIRESGKGYDQKKARASFVGFFPKENPQVVGIIIFDTPKTSKYGGETSAPTFRKVAERYFCLPQFMIEQFKSSEDLVYQHSEPSSEDSNRELDIIMNINSKYQSSSNTRTVPDFKGLTLNQALALAAAKKVEFEFNGSGVVNSQYPRPGMMYQDGTIIKLKCGGE